MICPSCKQESGAKVMYMGFPMKLCYAEKCSCLWGFWSFIVMLFPWNMDGHWVFVGYERYWPSLWYWIRYGTDELNERKQK